MAPRFERAGLAPLRFHDLRTYAALTVAAGVQPTLLQAQLGRSSINVTLNTYGHLLADRFADVGDALDRLVRAKAARAGCIWVASARGFAAGFEKSLQLGMELGGLEPPTSWVRSRRSPN